MQTNEAIFNGSPVVNPGFFDSPIHDQYSNNPEPRKLVKTNEYSVNKLIRNTLNTNNDEYIVHEYPTRPSASLTYETDNASSSYYNPKYVNKYYNALEAFENKSEEGNNNKKFFFVLMILLIIFVIYCCK
jgi:hypothetical protein